MKKIKGNMKGRLNDETVSMAAKLIWEAELSLTAICKELQTSGPILIRSMNIHFHIPEDEAEPDWRKIYKVKRVIRKTKGNIRIVWECQSCSYESEKRFGQCLKCGSCTVKKTELRSSINSDEIQAMRMVGRRYW